MKTLNKHLPIKDDAFRATERGTKVCVRAFRHEVELCVSVDGEDHDVEYLTLAEVARRLARKPKK